MTRNMTLNLMLTSKDAVYLSGDFRLTSIKDQAVARRSRGCISEECVTGYVLSSGSAAIGAHGIPENSAYFPNWVRKDLEKGGVTGFEPAEYPEAKGLPIQWKGMTSRILNGT